MRVALLRELAANRESLVATHLSLPSVCHAAIDADAFRWVPGPWEYRRLVPFNRGGHEPKLFAGLSKPLDLKLVDRLEFGSGAVAMRYEPRR